MSGIGQNARFYEDFTIGDAWVTPRRTITEADIVAFSAFSGDHNPIHTDQEFAKTTIYGDRLLHGPAGFAIACHYNAADAGSLQDDGRGRRHAVPSRRRRCADAARRPAGRDRAQTGAGVRRRSSP